MDSKYINKIRLEELKKLIDNANYSYYTLDKPEIEDSLYDSLYRELINIEELFPELKTEDSPSNRVGGEISKGFKKIKHTIPLYSLDNAFNNEELNEWITRVKRLLVEKNYDIQRKNFFVAELKIDGNAIALKYENGLLKYAATRGDGKEGEDITNNAKRIKSIPLRLRIENPPKWIEVRGEAFISSKSFDAINQQRDANKEQLFANPRNACAGSLRQLDPKVVANRNLDFFAYQVYLSDESLLSEEYFNHWNRLQFLKKCGFKINKNSELINDKNELKNYCELWEKKRHQINFDTDGVVVKINDIKAQDILGYTQKSPRWAIALKYPAEEVSTKIHNLTFQVGRSGVVTPVANFEPVQLAGTKVSRATLHNIERFKDLNIHNFDTIVVRKAGEIIPEVVRVIEELRLDNSEEFKFPCYCPVCGEKLIKNIKEAATKCINNNCSAIQTGLFKHWVSKSAMNIDGLGIKVIKQLLKEGLIKNISDLYSLKHQDLTGLERMGEKSITNLLNAIKNSKKREWYKKLYALGINHIGEVTAKNICDVYANINELKEKALYNPDEVMKINGIGSEIIESLRDWFRNNNNLELISNLEKLGVKFYDNKIDKNIKLNFNKNINQKKFVITGIMKQYTRDELIKEIENYGGFVKKSLSSQIDYLIAGEKPGSKLNKAKQLGTNIIGEDEFNKLLK